MNGLTLRHLKGLSLILNFIYLDPDLPMLSHPYHAKMTGTVIPDAVKSWNNIGVELRSLTCISRFKSALVRIIRPPKQDIFNIHNPDGLRRLYQLRVGP